MRSITAFSLAAYTRYHQWLGLGWLAGGCTLASPPSMLAKASSPNSLRNVCPTLSPASTMPPGKASSLLSLRRMSTTCRMGSFFAFKTTLPCTSLFHLSRPLRRAFSLQGSYLTLSQLGQQHDWGQICPTDHDQRCLCDHDSFCTQRHRFIGI
eukprot:TRINITY_DN10605_c0_g1_i3.p1 TRINITY_DN10605_c0_g1~~TRINITY_DN10605_c0_g1_i3.p1  ORF type:complete len:153 (-),score=2.68 TRINITY_DN10605_c0_g1_i3:398-856(-)